MAPAVDSETSSQGTWREWARHVLAELKRSSDTMATVCTRMDDQRTATDLKLTQMRLELQRDLEVFRTGATKDISELKTQIALLKLKAGVWGAIGACIPIITSLLVAMLVYFVTKGPAG